MPRYAQVNMETGVIESDSSLRDEGLEKEFPHLIPIDDSFDLHHKKYDFETESWVEYIPEPSEPELTLSETEQAIFETAINTEYLVCLADLGL